MVGVLAKLAGQESSSGMAHWAKLRRHELSQLFHLKRESMPNYSTWSRVLGHGVEPHEVEERVGQFFAQALSLTLYISNALTDGQRPPLKSRVGY